jgi:epoxyqueuosine reductase
MKHVIKEKITQFAKSIGFDLVGFSDIKVDEKNFKFYKDWLKKGNASSMDYLQKTSPRKDLKEILPSANTVISLATNYYYEQKPLKQGNGRVARYAYGRDYHKIIGKKLKQLEAFIKTLDANAETKSYVDTGPILERSFAEKSGLGTVGKNSCLITKEFGSWVFISEIITSLKIKSTNKILKKPSSKKDFAICGTCTRCIDSCPMQAIVSPGTIDARKCISYLTIENKKQIPKKIQAIIKKSKRLYGCDICQEVCPHNCRAKENNHEEFYNQPIATDQLNLQKILAIKSDAEFLKTFAGSPLMRAKRKGLQRNANIL